MGNPVGLYLPANSAIMLLQPIFLFLIVSANFAFFTITDWPDKKTKKRFLPLMKIYLIVLTGFAIEYPALVSHTGEDIFHEANTPNKPLETISNWLIPYSIFGNFIIDVYFFYLDRFSNKITIKIMGYVLDTL